jgi:class 3 adenylate cyclase
LIACSLQCSGARYIEVPGKDHLPFVGDNTDEIADAIEEFLTGSRPPVAVNRVLATVLFTDIVGSTEKAAALGDHRWRDLLDNHHATIQNNLTRFRGRKVKTTGDGILATFDGPARGVRCACAISEEMRPLGIEVRAGLHTGECEMMGDDVGGIAVHIGARVAALAGAGEVLVSSTVKDLVAGSGLRFGDRGISNYRWELIFIMGGLPTIRRATSRVPIGTGINPTGFLHKRLDPCTRRFVASDIPQCSRPFADCLAIDVIRRRAANDRSKWICILVEGQLSKFKCVTQKLPGSPPHLVMGDDREHGL